MCFRNIKECFLEALACVDSKFGAGATQVWTRFHTRWILTCLGGSCVYKELFLRTSLCSICGSEVETELQYRILVLVEMMVMVLLARGE